MVAVVVTGVLFDNTSEIVRLGESLDSDLSREDTGPG